MNIINYTDGQLDGAIYECEREIIAFFEDEHADCTLHIKYMQLLKERTSRYERSYKFPTILQYIEKNYENVLTKEQIDKIKKGLNELEH